MGLGLREQECCFPKLEVLKGRQARRDGWRWTPTNAYQRCFVFFIPKGRTKRITPLYSCRDLWLIKGCHRYLLPGLITLPAPSPHPSREASTEKTSAQSRSGCPRSHSYQAAAGWLGSPSVPQPCVWASFPACGLSKLKPGSFRGHTQLLPH